MLLNFKSMLTMMIVSLCLATIMASLSYLLSSKLPDKEKISIYECGFDPLGTPGNPFSISFFLMGILFLVFDIEIAFMFPWAILPLTGFWVVILFLLMLTVGLMYEWLKGGLDWE